MTALHVEHADVSPRRPHHAPSVPGCIGEVVLGTQQPLFLFERVMQHGVLPDMIA